MTDIVKKLYITTFLLLGAVTATGSAQNGPDNPTGDAPEGKWTLQACIDHALEHNISVRQSEIELKQREVELSTARGRRLPGVSASASENLSFGRGLTADNTYTNSNTTSTSFTLGAEIPVFQGFDIKNGIKLGRLSLAAATEDLEKAKDDIRVSVAEGYVQILYCKEMLKVAQAQVELDEELLEQVCDRANAGKLSEADVVAQEATLAQSRLTLTEADNNLQLALLDLSQLLELSSPEGFDIAEPPLDTFEPRLLENPESIYAAAVEEKPAVRSAMLNLEYAEVSIAKAKGAYLPSLSLTGGIGTNFYTTSNLSSDSFGRQLENNFSQYIGLTLSVPVFSRFSTRNSVRSAELDYQNLQLEVESVRKSLYKEIQQAYYNAVAAQAQYASSEETARSSRKNFEMTEEKYRGGKAGISEYNDAKNSLLSAESDLVRSKYECLFQTRLLDFYKGENIAF